MAQGSRGRWLRVASTGFGVVLCTGLVGCMNGDAPKNTKATPKLPPPGLTGTPMLPSGAGAGAVGRTGQPSGQFAGAGANLQPAGGFQPAGGSFAGQRYPTNGLNGNTTGQPPAYNNAAAPGAPGFTNAPTQPGYVPPSAQPILPAGGSGSPSQYLGGAPYSPPPPSLQDTPLPPGPPVYGPPGGAEPVGGILPPVPASSMAPLMPTPPAGVTGKGPPPLTNFGSP